MAESDLVYEVVRGFLWFEKAGIVLADVPAGLDASPASVYRTINVITGDVLVARGSSLFRIDGRDNISEGNLTCIDGQAFGAELERLAKHGFLNLSTMVIADFAVPHVPVLLPGPVKVERSDLSEGMNSLIDATAELPELCADAGFNLIYEDMGMRRVVKMSICDMETDVSCLVLEIDPVDGSARYQVSNEELAARLGWQPGQGWTQWSDDANSSLGNAISSWLSPTPLNSSYAFIPAM